MKRLIRFIAKISGVEKDIRQEQRHLDAVQIKSASYWFTNSEKYGVIYPFLTYMSGCLSYNFWINGDSMRKTYDQLLESNLHKSDGHWKDVSFNRTTGGLKIEADGDGAAT